MEQQKVFPNAMFGFDKKTVLDYIYQQDAQAKERETQYEAAAAQAEAEISRLKSVVDDLSSQMEITKAQMYREKEAAANQKAAYDKLRQEADHLIQAARNKDNELQIQLELNKQLQNKYAEQGNRILELEGQLEEMKAAAGKPAAVQVEREAEEVLNQAKAEARKLLERAEQKAAARSQEIARLKEELDAFRADAARTLAGMEASIAKLYQADGDTEKKESQPNGESHDIHFFR